jgi:hypothetical protein
MGVGSFPAPYLVDWFAFSSTGIDELGNAVQSWSSPVQIAVQGWDITSMVTQDGHIKEEHLEGFLMCPPDFSPSIKDRIRLPEGLFEITGRDIEIHGFDRWQPGNIFILKRVEG